jgi:hypothetical protein
MSAPQLSDQQFKEIDVMIRSGKHVPADQRAAHEKAVIERTLKVTLSAEIIKLNQDGKLIDKVKVFSSLESRFQALIFKDHAKELTNPGTQKRWGKSSAQQLVRFVAYICGLLDNAGNVDPKTIVSQETLFRFITFCRLNRTIIEEITGNQLRTDVDQRAVMQLNQFLALAGLRLVTVSRTTRDGVQTHLYKLDPDRLALMVRLSKTISSIEFSDKSASKCATANNSKKGK